jgi:hypothetical protein
LGPYWELMAKGSPTQLLLCAFVWELARFSQRCCAPLAERRYSTPHAPGTPSTLSKHNPPPNQHDTPPPQVLDTPGILDRPLEDRNTIEMQSVTALAHLRAAVLYLVDVSEQCGYTLAQQVAGGGLEGGSLGGLCWGV